MSKITRPILTIIYTLVLTGVLLIWVMQDSINAYWTQTYHQHSPLAGLSRHQQWQWGSKVHQNLLKKMDGFNWQVLDNTLVVKMIVPEEQETIIAELPTTDTAANLSQSVIAPNAIVLESIASSPTVTDNTKITLRYAPLWKKEKLMAWQHLSFLKQKTITLASNQQLSVKPPLIDSTTWQVSGKRMSRIISSLPPVEVEKTASVMLVKKADKVITEQSDNKHKRVTILSSLADSKPVAASKQPIPLPITNTVKNIPQSVIVGKQQMVFFAGDSLMQGIAPHVKAVLHNKYGIKSIDLSKQSTGLTYSSLFDWPKTIKTTLERHNDIGLIVVFLGPNDPWDMPNPRGGKYLKFQSNEWETVYREKIRQIMTLADKHRVKIIWLGVPDMREHQLNKGVRYLNTLYRSEVENAGEIFLPTQFLLTGKTAGYSKYVTTDTHKKVAVRTNDGIHFTVTGQKRIARRILSKITIKED